MPALTGPPDWRWQDHAACKGQSVTLFYGLDGERGPQRDARERRALSFCARCPVREQCLAYALAQPEKNGVWGGLTEEARTAERRRRMRRVEPAA
jgi:WhiB family redox-sensing transcriptional regulator